MAASCEHPELYSDSQPRREEGTALSSGFPAGSTFTVVGTQGCLENVLLRKRENTKSLAVVEEKNSSKNKITWRKMTNHPPPPPKKKFVKVTEQTCFSFCYCLISSAFCLTSVACVCPLTFAGKKQFIAEAVCKKFMYQLVKAVDHMHR